MGGVGNVDVIGEDVQGLEKGCGKGEIGWDAVEEEGCKLLGVDV